MARPHPSGGGGGEAGDAGGLHCLGAAKSGADVDVDDALGDGDRTRRHHTYPFSREASQS